MNEKDFKLNINTTADTSGAEKVEAALEKVEAQADATAAAGSNAAAEVSATFDPAEVDEMANALDEVEEKLEAVGDASGEADEQLKKLVNLEKAQAIAKIGGALHDMGRMVGGLRKELNGAAPELEKTLGAVETGMDSVGNALAMGAQGFAVGGPYGAAIGGFIGLAMGPLKGALNEMTTDLKNAAIGEQNAAVAMANYKSAVASAATEMREARFEGFWSRIAGEVDKATEAIRRQKAEMDAKAKADTAEREVGQKQAAAAGADPGNLMISDIGADIQDRLAKLESDGETSRKLLDQMEKTAVDAELAASDAFASGSERFKELEQKASEARKVADKAQEDFSSEQKIAESEARDIMSDAESRKIDAVRKFGEDAAASADSLVKELENSGAPLAASNLAGIEKIKQITADQQVKANEQTALMEAFAQALAGVQTNTATYLSIAGKQNEATAVFSQQLRAVEAEVERLKRQATTNPGPIR